MVDDRVPGLYFAMAGLSACAAVTFTNPFEVIKTRLQLQGELQSTQVKAYRGIFHAFVKIGRSEGLRGLQKGLLPAYGYQIIMNGVRFGGYDAIKSTVTSVVSPKSFAANEPHFVSNVISGAVSGIVGACLGSPFFLVKTRLQSASAMTPEVGFQHKYDGTVDGLTKIYRSEGVRGLFGGAQAAALRTGVGSSVQLATYEKAKSTMQASFEIQNDMVAALLGSLVSGFLVCTAMNPFDVVMTRLYNQEGNVYKGPLDCFVKTVRSEGFGALYKGFGAHYLRIGPHTSLMFVFLEALIQVANKYDIKY